MNKIIYKLCFAGGKMKKNTGLIILIILGILFLVAMKLNWLPNLKSSYAPDETQNQESFNIRRTEDGVQKNYFDDGSVQSETPYKNSRVD